MTKQINVSLLFGIVVTVFLIAILATPTISAGDVTIVLNTPAASARVSGSTVFNVTVTNLTAMGNLTNFTFYAKSASVNDTDWVVIGTNNSLNMTTYGNGTETTIDLTGIIEDASNYIFNVTMVNSTATADVLDEDTNTGIEVDHTVPQAGTIVTPSDNSIDIDGSFVFNVSVSGGNTTDCTLRFDGINPGTSTYSMTHLGEACYYSATSLPEQTYNWYVTASDGRNTTDSSVWTVGVESKKSASKIPALLQEPGVVSSGGASLSVVDTVGTTITTKIGGVLPVWVIVIAVVGVMVFVLKKRKR